MSTSHQHDVATIPELLRRAARDFATRDYVVTPDQRLTFADAERQSRLAAKWLVQDGVGKGTRVGLLFPQGPDFIVALLAITRVGAIAVPLSTFARGPELQRALRHADIASLIAPRELLGRDTQDLLETAAPELSAAENPRLHLAELPYLRRVWLCGGAGRSWATGVPLFEETVDDPDISDHLIEQLESEVTPADLMVLIYTSGATAEPKAVAHTHGAQVRHARALAEPYELTAETRTFTTMPFFWVGGLTVALLSHLHVGGAVLTVPRLDNKTMLDLIEQERPTRLSGWTLTERLMSDPSFGERDLSWLPELRLPGVVGDVRRPNSLGMSETCGPHTATSGADRSAPLPDHLVGSFGRPIAGMHHKIVDPDSGEALDDEIEGEICVRGYSLMNGLYKKERSDTFDHDGWYHTGDRGYFRDGNLFFTGRLTEMIKTDGANVAPREVELALETLPGVKAAFVVGLPDANRGQLVACLVCPEPDQPLDPDELTGELSAQLSSYKVPRRMLVVPYDDAPWLPSGKISKPRIVELFTHEEG